MAKVVVIRHHSQTKCTARWGKQREEGRRRKGGGRRSDDVREELAEGRTENISPVQPPHNLFPPKSPPNSPPNTPYTPGCPRPMLTSKYTLEGVTNRPAIEAVLELIRLSKPFPETKLPGSVVRQREIVAELEEEFQQSAVNQVTVTAVCLPV